MITIKLIEEGRHVGRYIAKFSWQRGWHYIVLATATQKQEYSFEKGKTIFNSKLEEPGNLSEIKKLIPHLHKEVRRQLKESGAIK